MPLCEKIELVGALCSGAQEIEAIECLVVPKGSPSILAAAIEKEFGQLLYQDDSEIVYFYYDTRVELTLTTSALWEASLRLVGEAA